MATMRKPGGAIAGVLAAFVLCGVFFAAFYFWTRGEPYQEPFRSPNGQYYVQKYRTFRLGVGAGPGQGSDSDGGYIRLFDKDGRQLQERRQDFFRDIKPVWADNKVYLLGVAEMDDRPWILPGPSGGP